MSPSLPVTGLDPGAALAVCLPPPPSAISPPPLPPSCSPPSALALLSIHRPSAAPASFPPTWTSAPGFSPSCFQPHSIIYSLCRLVVLSPELILPLPCSALPRALGSEVQADIQNPSRALAYLSNSSPLCGLKSFSGSFSFFNPNHTALTMALCTRRRFPTTWSSHGFLGLRHPHYNQLYPSFEIKHRCPLSGKKFLASQAGLDVFPGLQNSLQRPLSLSAFR